MGQGRVPPAAKVFFGSVRTTCRMEYTGAMDITVGSKTETTDHVNVFIKGPASDLTVEIFFARDAARTPAAGEGAGAGRHGLAGTGAPLMRVAFFCPLPPARSGIADYSEALIDALKPLVDLEVFSGPDQAFDPARFDIALYQVGNNGYPRLRLRDRAAASRRGGDAREQPAPPDRRSHHQARRLGRLPARVRIRRRRRRRWRSPQRVRRPGSRAGLRRRAHDAAPAGTARGVVVHSRFMQA